MDPFIDIRSSPSPSYLHYIYSILDELDPLSLNHILSSCSPSIFSFDSSPSWLFSLLPTLLLLPNGDQGLSTSMSPAQPFEADEQDRN